MTYLIIFYEFCKIGLFAIGGGFATLPFLYHMGSFYHWFSAKDLTQMLAISSTMPGPIGINLATTTGFAIKGAIGSFLAVVGIMTPALIFVILVSKILKKFRTNKFVISLFYILKPVSCAMVTAIGFKLLKTAVYKPIDSNFFASVDWIALLIFGTLLALSFQKKRNPLFYVVVSAVAGIAVHVIKPLIIG